MNIHELIARVDEIRERMNGKNINFKQMLENCRQLSGEEGKAATKELLMYMINNHYGPYDLDSDSDINLTAKLFNLRHPKAFALGLVIAYHRLSFGDLLEKAFMSDVLLWTYQYQKNFWVFWVRMFMKKLRNEASHDYDRYKGLLTDEQLAEDAEEAGEKIVFDLARLFVGEYLWYCNEYPQAPHSVAIDEVEALGKELRDTPKYINPRKFMNNLVGYMLEESMEA